MLFLRKHCVSIKLEVLISNEKIQTGICTFPANIENFFLENCLQNYKNGTVCNLVVLQTQCPSLI